MWHQLSQLDAMVWFMWIVVSVAFVVAAVVLVDLFPGRGGTETNTPTVDADEGHGQEPQAPPVDVAHNQR